MINSIILFFYMILAAVAQLYYKLSINHESKEKLFFIAIGIILNFVGLLLYLWVLKKMPLSIAYPSQVIGSIIILSILSSIFLNESISIKVIFGILFGMISVILITNN